MRLLWIFVFLMALTLEVCAQKERKFIREGNTLFETQKFEQAEVEYRKAMDKKAESFEAAFNLADALYKQEKYDEALLQFSTLAKEQTDKEKLGQLYHNIGNTLLSMKKTDESIEAYKESLRNRPNAEETKYNLEFARHKKQQDEQNKDNQDNKDNKDNKDQQNKDQQQNQDNKDQNKDQQDQNKDQQNQDKDKQDKDKDQNQNKDQQDQNKDQQQQQQPGKISKEDAQRLLDALQNDEKKVQEKVQQQKVQEQKSKKMKIEKDW